MREITVNKNDAGQRLDKFLSKAVKGLPTSMMYKLIRTKKIKARALLWVIIRTKKETASTHFVCSEKRQSEFY